MGDKLFKWCKNVMMEVNRIPFLTVCSTQYFRKKKTNILLCFFLTASIILLFQTTSMVHLNIQNQLQETTKGNNFNKEEGRKLIIIYYLISWFRIYVGIIFLIYVTQKMFNLGFYSHSMLCFLYLKFQLECPE